LNGIENVLFDLDGTLTDPKLGITSAVRYSLQRLGVEAPSADELTVFIGPPLWASYKKYFGFDEEKANEAVTLYREYFADRGLFENELYAGIPEMLADLRERGFRAFVATSKPSVYARRITDHFGLSAYFESVEGSELDGRRSDKAELIAHVLASFGLDKRRTVMVGDREHDIIGAVKNGIASIGVGYGYGSREELEAAGASHYVASVEELRDILA